MIKLECETQTVVAGEAIKGVALVDRPVLGSVIRLELNHSNGYEGNTWTFSRKAVPPSVNVLTPAEPLSFEFPVPSWIAPTFDTGTMSSTWTLCAFVDETPNDRAAAKIRILPAAPGAPMDDRPAAETEWRRQREHWGSVKHRGDDHQRLGGILYSAASAGLVAGVAGWMFGWIGFLFGLVAGTPMLGTAFARYVRTLSQTGRGEIRLMGVPQTVESGEHFSLGVEYPGSGSVNVTLRCTEWRYISQDGSSYAKPAAVYEQEIALLASGRVEFQVPSAALPSVRVGPSAIHWSISAHHGNAHKKAPPSIEEHLVVMARAVARRIDNRPPVRT